jgi:hypothetical protein
MDYAKIVRLTNRKLDGGALLIGEAVYVLVLHRRTRKARASVHQEMRKSWWLRPNQMAAIESRSSGNALTAFMVQTNI